MSELEKIEWDPKYSVDIEEIDTHQKKLFDMFNQLIDLKESQASAKECVNMISDINEYSRLFFSTEERLLRRKKYPDHKAHAKAHRQFTKTSISLRREISDDVKNLTNEVIMGLREWLMDHILTYDSLYIPFLRIRRHIDQSK